MYISIINFTSHFRIIYEKEDIMNIDISKIIYKGGSTKFEPVF